MRIVTLRPYLTDIVASLGLSPALAGCTHQCVIPEESVTPAVVTKSPGEGAQSFSATEQQLVTALSTPDLDLDALHLAKPDLVLTETTESDALVAAQTAQGALEKVLGRKVRVHCSQVRTLQGMYETFEGVGAAAGRAREGRELANRVKAQLLDWGDNFYDRMKNKKVTVISSVAPLTVAGYWIPSVIELASAHPQFIVAGEPDKRTTWADIASFRPDVIVVAPRGATLEESVRTLKVLEKVPEWEGIPAVKRGEVVFSEGVRLYAPGPRFLHGAGVLFSAIAGLESGYITKKDEFYRLRFLELHRHRFM